MLLDVGETLLRPEPSWRDVYASVFTPLGIEVTPDQFEQAFKEAWAGWEHEGPFEATEEGSFQRFMALDREVFRRLGYDDLPDEFFRSIDAAFHRRAAWRCQPPA